MEWYGYLAHASIKIDDWDDKNYFSSNMGITIFDSPSGTKFEISPSVDIPSHDIVYAFVLQSKCSDFKSSVIFLTNI